MEQVLQELLIVSDSRQLGGDAAIELPGVAWREIVQLIILQPTPQKLDRIQGRRPGWQILQTQSVREAGPQVPDRVSFVHRALIPDHHEAARQFLQHRLQEGGHIPVIEIVVDQRVEIQPQAIPQRREPQRRRDGDFLVGAALVQDRGMAAWRPTSAINIRAI